jgi:hypothetical protein
MKKANKGQSKTRSQDHYNMANKSKNNGQSASKQANSRNQREAKIDEEI